MVGGLQGPGPPDADHRRTQEQHRPTGRGSADRASARSSSAWPVRRVCRRSTTTHMAGPRRNPGDDQDIVGSLFVRCRVAECGVGIGHLGSDSPSHRSSPREHVSAGRDPSRHDADIGQRRCERLFPLASARSRTRHRHGKPIDLYQNPRALHAPLPGRPRQPTSGRARKGFAR